MTRTSTSFTVQGRKLALLQAAADARGQSLGACARDLAVRMLEAEQAAQDTLQKTINQVADDVAAIRAEILP